MRIIQCLWFSQFQWLCKKYKYIANKQVRVFYQGFLTHAKALVFSHDCEALKTVKTTPPKRARVFVVLRALQIWQKQRRGVKSAVTSQLFFVVELSLCF